MSLPSLAEVEHADWPSLKRICEALGLNPKGRSAVVRSRALEYVRRRVRAEPWRAKREHVASLLTRLGFPDVAEDLWESTIQFDAPAPWVGLGQAQLAGGFLTEAAKSFGRGIQMGDRAAILHLAEADSAGGDFDRAIHSCDSYLTHHPDDLRAVAMKADFLARAAFTEEGTRVLRRAAESRPGIPGLPRAVGIALLKAGRPEVALESFQEAIRADPNDVDARINLGACLVLAGRAREALRALREALAIDPHRAEALNNLAVAHLELGQVRSAVVNIRRASKGLESAQIASNLTKIRAKADDRAPASRASRRAPSQRSGRAEAPTAARMRTPRARKGRKQ